MHTDFSHYIIIFFTLIVNRVYSIPISDVDRSEGVIVRTVPWGKTVILKCMSNDNAHNFQYWHMVDQGLIIGPANKFNPAKFRFEILSGNLTIRVSAAKLLPNN